MWVNSTVPVFHWLLCFGVLGTLVCILRSARRECPRVPLAQHRALKRVSHRITTSPPRDSITSPLWAFLDSPAPLSAGPCSGLGGVVTDSGVS